MTYTDAELLAYLRRLHKAWGSMPWDAEPMVAITDEGVDIAWEVCKRGWITFQLEITDRGLAALE